MGFLRNQFRKVIQWENVDPNCIAYKYPLEKQVEVMKHSKLVVREGQTAVFVNMGKCCDVFGPGTYDLDDVKNIPILTAIYSWKYAFESPFTADIIFFQTRQFIDNKWGTANPITMRDPEFGVVRIRGFGKYSFAITAPSISMFEIVGSTDTLYKSDVDNYFKSIITSIMSNSIAEGKYAAIDLAMHYDDIADLAKVKLADEFTPLGITIKNVFIENLSLPSNVEEVLDKRTSVGVMKDAMGDYATMSSIDAMKDAAKTPNSFAGFGVQFGAGLNAVNKFMNSLNNIANDNNSSQNTSDSGVKCPKCGSENAKGAKFCCECGSKLEAAPAQSKFCSECGTKIAPNGKFCPNCGKKVNE